MVLCRFADQTAVQLPEDRRLTGTTSKKKKTAPNFLLNETPGGQRADLVPMNVALQTSDPGSSRFIKLPLAFLLLRLSVDWSECARRCPVFPPERRRKISSKREKLSRGRFSGATKQLRPTAAGSLPSGLEGSVLSDSNLQNRTAAATPRPSVRLLHSVEDCLLPDGSSSLSKLPSHDEASPSRLVSIRPFHIHLTVAVTPPSARHHLPGVNLTRQHPP